jgi:hypothetical protein
MYCPSCGSEERQMSQYCRACGTDLRPIRVSLERPDSITASAASAREDIGRAVAGKIRELEGSRDLKRVAEDVLPKIEKFLESPEEKRLRRMRSGVITGACGIGASVIALLLLSVVEKLKDPDAVPSLLFLCGLGIVTFLIGLGLVLNGFLFTKPRKALRDNSADARSQNMLDVTYQQPQLPSGEKSQFSGTPTTADFSRRKVPVGASVTDQTTRHLKSDS